MYVRSHYDRHGQLCKLTLADHRLLKQGLAEERQWENLLRTSVLDNLKRRLQSAIAKRVALSPRWTIHFPSIPLSKTTYRKVFLGCIGFAITSVVLSAGAVAKGYLDHPASFWNERIASRTQSPIYDSEQTLIGSIAVYRGNLPLDQARDYAYIPLRGELPKTYLLGLLKMENQHYLEGGWHNICGLDLPATLKRWFVSSGAGGSTLSMQLARELKRPEWGNETNIAQKIWRKGLEIGASCRLHQVLVEQGGIMAPLKLYASYAPTFQGNGTLRGIEAASRIVFDLAPGQLSDAQQLVLAAAARKPLTLLPRDATRIDCTKLYPRLHNASFDSQLAKDNLARAVQCQILHRAIYRAPEVLEGERLTLAMTQLRQFQEQGVQLVNPFQMIPAKRLINLASRTAATMPASLLVSIEQEVGNQTIEIGEALDVTIDAQQQNRFETGLLESLQRIQARPAMRNILCLPLVPDEKSHHKLKKCGNEDNPIHNADVLAIRIDVVSGAIKTLSASSPLLLDSVQSIGSTAKWVVLLAALADGHQTLELRCPISAQDGGRFLKRVSLPEVGFENCDKGRHLMTWERAIAESDNLVFYALAKELGEQKLAQAAAALSMTPVTSNEKLAYALSFGTFGATPRALIGAAQAMVIVAYGIPVDSPAPHALGHRRTTANPAIAAIKKLLPHQAQRDALRELMSAPVRLEGGTLAYLRDTISAGKSGTVQSVMLAPNGRHYNHGKWNITYQHPQRALNLFFIASPLPSVPLAQPEFGFAALLPAHMQLLKMD